MPTLILKCDARELQETAVGTQPVSIGRLPDNTIVIDNAAVSARHARVFRDGNHFVVEDLRSARGTFVNDKPIAEHTLSDGDVMRVGTHTLVFRLAGSHPVAPAGAVEAAVAETGGRPMLDPVRHKSLLGALDHGRASQAHDVITATSLAAPRLRGGFVRVVSGRSARAEYALTSITNVIGTAESAQIKTRGWFKPKMAAALARSGDGFMVTSLGATVTVNGQKIAGRQDLRDGDMIQVSGLTLEFRLV